MLLYTLCHVPAQSPAQSCLSIQARDFIAGQGTVMLSEA